MSGLAWREQVADALTRLAARRLKATHPDWAEAMIAERASQRGQVDPLAWSFGCLRASWAATDLGQALYPIALIAGVVLMTIYEWSADESAATYLLLGFLGLALGMISPKRFLVSALAVGLVVAAVTAFEAITGVRPAYEHHAHPLVSSARWITLVLPALIAATAGRLAGRWLRA